MNDLNTPIEGMPLRFWFHKYIQDGDDTMLYEHDLTPDSIVFDVGSFTGEVSDILYKKYQCNIYAFEPIKKHYSQYRQKVKDNNKIRLFNFGLGVKTQIVKFGVKGNASGSLTQSSEMEHCSIVSFSEFLELNPIEKIDLLKINIEGGEYNLLEHILDTGLLSKVKSLLIQFHHFDSESISRRHQIHRSLNGFRCRFCYPFVWECWDKVEGIDV